MMKRMGLVVGEAELLSNTFGIPSEGIKVAPSI